MHASASPQLAHSIDRRATSCAAAVAEFASCVNCSRCCRHHFRSSVCSRFDSAAAPRAFCLSEVAEKKVLSRRSPPLGVSTDVRPFDAEDVPGPADGAEAPVPDVAPPPH
eukprot:6646181-Prymnesium_polylepis.1